MFKELKQELRRLNGTHKVSVAMPADPEGYTDRQCPSGECMFQFKLHENDWAQKVRDEEVFCPFCGHTADSTQWWTQQQIEYAKDMALAQIQQRIGHAMQIDAQHWNRRQKRDSFLNITLKVNNKPQHIPLSSANAEPMRLKITCPACSCRYAVIGAAFFCPACGHNAADLMFQQAITSIRKTLDVIPQVRSAIADRDGAQNITRLLMENSLQNAVTAFQRYAESLYAGLPSMSPPRRNAFQNINEGSRLWNSVTGKHYNAYLEGSQIASLNRLFQQRHLLAHTQGIVDVDYVVRTGDTTYQEGQRLVIHEDTVRECLSLIEMVIAGMTAEISAHSVREKNEERATHQSSS